MPTYDDIHADIIEPITEAIDKALKRAKASGAIRDFNAESDGIQGDEYYYTIRIDLKDAPSDE